MPLGIIDRECIVKRAAGNAHAGGEDGLIRSVVRIEPPDATGKALRSDGLRQGQPTQRIRKVQRDGHNAPKRTVEIDRKPPRDAKTALHKGKRPRHDHGSAFNGGLRFLISRLCAGEVVAQHAFVTHERVDVADDAARREQDIAHRAVGDEQAGDAFKSIRSAVALHNERLQRLCLV